MDVHGRRACEKLSVRKVSFMYAKRKKEAGNSGMFIAAVNPYAICEKPNIILYAGLFVTSNFIIYVRSGFFYFYSRHLHKM